MWISDLDPAVVLRFGRTQMDGQISSKRGVNGEDAFLVILQDKVHNYSFQAPVRLHYRQESRIWLHVSIRNPGYSWFVMFLQLARWCRVVAGAPGVSACDHEFTSYNITTPPI